MSDSLQYLNTNCYNLCGNRITGNGAKMFLARIKNNVKEIDLS